jgi:hypothetical protein
MKKGKTPGGNREKSESAFTNKDLNNNKTSHSQRVGV